MMWFSSKLEERLAALETLVGKRNESKNKYSTFEWMNELVNSWGGFHQPTLVEEVK
jgi:hypothetical protein